MRPETIRNGRGERIASSYTPGDEGRRDMVVIGHGLTSDRDRPWSEAISRGLAERGIASLRIAFSGNGDSEGEFHESTITKEVSDLGAVLDALPDADFTYVGHSMGGAVGLLRAARDRRIRDVVSLAAITHTAEFIHRMFEHLEYGEAMLDKPHCPYGRPLEQDMIALDSLEPRATDVTVPWLVVHGTSDDVVPDFHSRDLCARAGPNAELVLLDGVDHSFTGDGLAAMIDVVVPWIAARFQRR